MACTARTRGAACANFYCFTQQDGDDGVNDDDDDDDGGENNE